MDNDNILPIRSPLLLVLSSQKCWKCRKEQRVIAIGFRFEGESDEGYPSLVCEIEEMPDELLDKIQMVHAPYRMHRSRTLGASYYANFCECGANFGDHFLFMEPGGAFFPMDETAASRMTIVSVEFDGAEKIVGNVCYGAEDLIFKHAQKME